MKIRSLKRLSKPFLLTALCVLTGCPTMTPDPDPDPTPTPTTAEVQFRAPQLYAADAGPESVATLLLNGDLYPDIVSANFEANTINLWLSTGPNRYGSALRLLSKGSEPREVAINRLPASGIADIVTANSGSNDVTRIPVDDAGNRLPAAVLPLPENAAPRDVACADLNGDDLGDIITANTGINSLSILFGQESGEFSEPTTLATGAAPRSLAIADLDDDGDLDIVTANRDSNSLTVLLNDGSGNFPSARDLPTGNTPRAVAISDINQDGNNDIIASCPRSAAFAVHTGSGDGNFGNVVLHTVAGNPTRFTLGDFTGDGRTDILAILFEDDAATVSSGVLQCLAGDGAGNFEQHATYRVTPGVIAVLGIDLDLDGALDVVTADNANDTIAIIAGKDSTLGAERRYNAGERPRMAASADLNKDGALDVVVANLESQNVSVLLGDGEGALGDAIMVPAGGTARALALGHINSDTNLDIVVTNLHNSRVALLTGRGDGTFNAATYHDVRSGDSTRSAEPRSVAIADVNSDGDNDLIVGNANRDTVAVLLGAGDGTFGEVTEYEMGNFPLSVKTADFNNDGNLDIAVANGIDADGSGTPTSAVHVLPGLGDGTFDVENEIGYVVITAPGSLAVGDLNADGNMDFATSHSGLGSVQIYYGRGDGRFNAGGVLAMGDTPNAVSIQDIDNDGLLDIFTTSNANTVSIRLFDQTLGFGNRIATTVGDLPIEALLADLNGDGPLDIIAPSRNDNSVAVLLGQRP